MALRDKINTAKDVLSNTRSRVVVVLLGLIVVVVLGVSYIKFKHSQQPAGGGSAINVGVPNITSIPGMGQPTREYAKLQEQQNIELAAEAARKGTAAMPTVIRTTYLDTGVFSDNLAKNSGASSAAGCGVTDLKKARSSGVTAEELRCRGCSLAALKAAGYTAGELRNAGFSASDLKAAGFSSSELKAAGFTASDLAAAGFSARELAAAGFSAGELKQAGFNETDLRSAGFGENEIRNAGFMASASNSDNCEISKLQAARGKGIGAAEFKKMGCSAQALRAAGFTASELKAAGFSAGDLKDAGFSAAELAVAGFSAQDLKNAGFSAKDLKEAGFSAKDLKDAGFSAGELNNAGFSAKDLKEAGFSASDLKNAGFKASDLAEAGFSGQELIAAGYTNGDLVRAGMIDNTADNNSQVTAKPSILTCNVNDLAKARANGISGIDLKKLGCSAAVLRAAGFTPDELKNAGFSAAELNAAGFGDDELKAVGFTVDKVNPSSAGNAQANLVHSVASSPYSNLQDRLGKLTKEQAASLSAQELDTLTKQTQAMMSVQANQLVSAWTPIPAQQYVQGEPPQKNESTTATNKEESAEKSKLPDTSKNDIYKAGTIMFAVLDTEVNSDENSPIMATVIQGPLKGSKALGNFQRVDKKVLMQFTVLSVPSLDMSIPMQAVAIDPNNAKTPMASEVDNHYWQRYGNLFASAFVGGLGEAFQNAGGTIVSDSSSTRTVTPALTTAQKMVVALGNVGQQFSTTLASRVNMPPTVKVKAGTSMGLLLMADLAVPKETKKNT